MSLAFYRDAQPTFASKTDVDEAYLAGQAAVQHAVQGITDKMVAFERAEGSEYKCNIKLVNLTDVANVEKKVPREWINKEGNGVTEDFIKYALPLIQGESRPPFENGLPRFARLKKGISYKIKMNLANKRGHEMCSLLLISDIWDAALKTTSLKEADIVKFGIITSSRSDSNDYGKDIQLRNDYYIRR